MRDGYTERLRNLIHRADPVATVIPEIVKEVREDVKDLPSEWAAADSLTGLEELEQGGVALEPSSTDTIVQDSDDGTEMVRLDRHAPWDGVMVKWTANGFDPDQEITTIVARLHPKADSGSAKEVVEWKCQLFRVEAVEQLRLSIEPISRVVIVEATGESAASITFDFTFPGGNPRVGGPPRIIRTHDEFGGSEEPTTIIKIWAVGADGSPAGNVAWLADSTISSPLTVSGKGRVEARTFTIASEGVEDRDRDGYGPKDEEGGSVFDVSARLSHIPRFSLNRPTYAEATVSFTGGNKPDLGAAPESTSDVELTIAGTEPGDSTIQGEIYDGSGWVVFKDGDLVATDNTPDGGADLTGVAKAQSYQMRATLTPSSDAFVTPTVRQLGIKEIERETIYGTATIQGLDYSVDPDTLKGSIPAPLLKIAKTGFNDYRDYASELLSEYHIGQIRVRIWIGHPTLLARSDWLLYDVFEVEDFDPRAAEVVVTLRSVLARLKVKRIPPITVDPSDSEKRVRSKQEYSNQTIADVYADLVDSLAALPARYRGPGLTGTDLISKTIRDAIAKEEMDRVAFLDGAGVISSQGRVKAVRMERGGDGSDNPVAVFPITDHRVDLIEPGFRNRTDELFVPYLWDEDAESFESRAQVFNPTAATKLGGPGLDSSPTLDEEIAKWIVSKAHAIAIGKRMTKHRANGRIIIRIQPIFAHPELEPGDPVVIGTDQFIARSPITDVPIVGRRFFLGIVQDTQDLHAVGGYLTAWVPSFDDIIVSDDDITNVGYLRPQILEGDIIFKADGTVIFRGIAREAGAIRAVVHKTTFQGASTIAAQDVVATDADGFFEVNLTAETFAYNEVCYLTARAYERADGTGAVQQSPDIFKRKEERSSLFGVGRIWATVDLATQTLDLYGTATGAADLFPAALTIYDGTKADGSVLQAHEFAASGDTIGPTGSGEDQEYASLTGLALPKSGLRSFEGEITFANGYVVPVFAADDLNELPDGSCEALDRVVDPTLRIRYDGDVARIVITTPDGDLTLTGLSGGGVHDYTVGDDLDSGSEDEFAVGESRTGYVVTLYSQESGGPSRIVYDGGLNGPDTIGPYEVRVVVQWKVGSAAAIEAGKPYYCQIDLVKGRLVNEARLTHNHGAGDIVDIYVDDTPGSVQSFSFPLSSDGSGVGGVTENPGSTKFFAETESGFTITAQGFGIGAEEGDAITVESGPPVESGAGVVVVSAAGLKIPGPQHEFGPEFDTAATGTGNSPKTGLRATNDAGNESGTWNPAMSDGGSQEVTATGALTLGAPSGMAKGQSMLIKINNGSGYSIGVTGMSYNQTGITDGEVYAHIHRFDSGYFCSLVAAA